MDERNSQTMQRRPAPRLSDSAKHCSDLCRHAPRFLMHRVGAVHVLYIKNVADVVLRFAVDGIYVGQVFASS